MALVAQGDTGALEKIYDRYTTAVFSLAMKMVADTLLAEEIVLETFVRAWRGASTFQAARGSLGSWLLGIARHLALDELRKRRRHTQVMAMSNGLAALGTEEDFPFGVAELALARIEGDALRQALKRLPHPQRQAIEMAFYQGLTQQEIARTLAEPLGTIKTRIRLGLQKLRTWLEMGGEEAGT